MRTLLLLSIAICAVCDSVQGKDGTQPPSIHDLVEDLRSDLANEKEDAALQLAYTCTQYPLQKTLAAKLGAIELLVGQLRAGSHGPRRTACMALVALSSRHSENKDAIAQAWDVGV